MNMLKRKQVLLGCAAAVCVMTAVWCTPVVSLADAEGTVTVETAKIREKADITSNVIGSSTQGKKVTIKDQVTDASGTIWYRVYVDADTLGYIRSDLVSTEGEISAAPTEDTAGEQSSTDASDTAAAGDAETPAETAMDAQYASVSVQAAKVRSGPSTNDGIVETLAEGTQVVVSGKSAGSDGKDWYYVTFTGADGAEKTGFVRNDLVTLGDMLPVEEEPVEEPAAEPEPVQNLNNDFELRYEQDGDEYVWYLYDNRDSQVGSKQKLEPLLEAAEQAMADTTPADTDTVVKQRIVIVVLMVVAVILGIAVIIMIFKLRDVYYEDYEDDEDEQEEEEPEEEEEVKPVRRKARPETAPEEAEETAKKAPRRKAVREEAPVKQKAERKPVMPEITYQEEPDVKVPVKTAPKRKARNFLIDDDDFEFEFLNMDDKDLK